MQYGVIYKATNTDNGLIYIGKTCQKLEKRWGAHCRNARSRNSSGKSLTAFHQAILQFGDKQFVLETIVVGSSREELDQQEKYWIAELESTNPLKGYNRTTGGQGGPHTEAAKSRMGRPWTEERRIRQIATMTGKKKSPEHAQKCRENFEKARKPEAKAKALAKRKARWTPEKSMLVSLREKQKWTKEARFELSHRRRQWWNQMSPKELAQIREEMSRGWTSEKREQLKEKRRQWWSDHPEAKAEFAARVRDIHAKVHLGAKRSEAARANMKSAQMKRRQREVV